MTRERVLPLGLLLLAVSLAATVAAISQQPAGPFEGRLALLQLLGWVGSVTTFTGAGLTVAGVVLRVLAGAAPEPEPEPIDHYGP